ncbi:MAG: putative ABC exporter domain-containing protein, partial [Candidatus Oleimicrobiaceae bacterium]
MLRCLLRNKLRIYLNLLGKVEGSRRARTLALVVLWLLFVSYVFQGSQALFRTAVQIAGPEAASKVLAPILFALLVALLLSGATICIHVLFISHDLPLLLSAPLSRRKVFVYKLIEATIGNSSLFLMLGVPVLLSFGAAQHAAWWYYPVMLAAAAVFLAVPTSLSAMVALLAVQVLPVRRAREVMSAALALVFMAVWTGMQLLRSSSDAHGAAEVGSILSFARGNWLAATPAGWLAAALSGLLHGKWMTVLAFGALLTASTAVMIAVSVALVDAVYSRGVGKEEFGGPAGELGSRRVRTVPSTGS